MAIDRGDVWLVDLNPVVGHEQAGTRPALIISDDLFNHSHAELVVVIPITSKDKGIPSHVAIDAGFLRQKSFLKTEDIRSVSVNRLKKKVGRVDEKVIDLVEERLKLILGFMRE